MTTAADSSDSTGTPEDRPLRVLLVISAQPSETLRQDIAAGREPRRDYFELQRALAADLLTPEGAQGSRVGRLLARVAGRGPSLAWAAYLRRHAYDAIYTDAESVGLPLALLLKYTGTRRGQTRHVMLTHYLSSGLKRVLFRLGAGSRIDTLIVHSSAQREQAVRVLRMREERVARLPYFADERFWRPQSVPAAKSGDAPMICAVGLEFRDYATLVAAVRDLPVSVRIGAASAWSHHSAFAGSPDLPSNVSIESYAYLPLRDLYASAHFVVVPLREVDNQSGITVVLEAMAMGKAVIVTATRGQTDVVRDRRNGGRGRVEREWWPAFVDAPGLRETLGRLATGFYVAPGDADDLRRAIRYLLDHPDVAEELGHNGRRVVEGLFGLDAFTGRFAAVVRGETPVLVAAAADAATA
jgi:glycosyltransferase involved in cell wall biosynthesis